MTLNQILQTCCIAHWVLAGLICLAILPGRLRIPRQMIPMILLVPIFGPVTAAAAAYIARTGRCGTRDITLEDPHLEQTDLRLQSVAPAHHGHVIPIQEALRINSANTRRALILEIIRQDPADYIHQLREACSDSDLEVSHYSSTALMEIQREFELASQKAEADCAKNPRDPEALTQAIRCIRRYIDSGLIDPSVAPAYRQRLALLLERYIQLHPEDMETRLAAVDNYLALDNHTQARILTDTALRRWPNREQVWLTQLKVCYTLHDAQGIRDTLAGIRSRNIYLSPEGKRILQFWQGPGKEGA